MDLRHVEAIIGADISADHTVIAIGRLTFAALAQGIKMMGDAPALRPTVVLFGHPGTLGFPWARGIDGEATGLEHGREYTSVTPRVRQDEHDPASGHIHFDETRFHIVPDDRFPEDQVYLAFAGPHAQINFELMGLIKIIDEPPENWWEYHLPGCGTQYRGCDPKCPKDIWEKTGRWR